MVKQKIYKSLLLFPLCSTSYQTNELYNEMDLDWMDLICNGLDGLDF